MDKAWEKILNDTNCLECNKQTYTIWDVNGGDKHEY